MVVASDGKVGIGTETPSSELTVSGAIETTTGGVIFPDGTSQMTAGVSSGNAWSLGGNAGTDPPTDYLGTSDATPLELRVNGERALRLEPASDSDGNSSPNVIAGDPANSVASGVIGATIAGGGGESGGTPYPNVVDDNFGTVGGGGNNTVGGFASTIGGGSANTTGAEGATVAGGQRNEASRRDATVGGGESNVASGSESTVGGGQNNKARGGNSTVSGGMENKATESGATVPGGGFNEARALYSFASGFRARVKDDHSGTFIWSGYGADSLVSTAPNQFLVRAANFVGFNRNAPITGSEAFGVRAMTTSNGFGGMYMETSSAAGRPFYGYANDGIASAYHYFDPSSDEWILYVGGPALRVSQSSVGIGTNAPVSQFHVSRELGGSAAAANHVAVLENTAASDGDVLALYTGASTPGAAENFITFKSAVANIGAIEGNGSGGIRLNTSGADFAEMLPRVDAGESIAPGAVVGVVGGRITTNTAGVDRLMVVTDRAAVIGNVREGDEATSNPVAFIGQVPVRVEGPVAIGDWIVASGRDDGTGRAVAPGAWNPERDGPIVGQAWAAQAGGTGRVNTAVGLDTTRPLLDRITRQQQQMEEQQTQIDALREEVQALRDLVRSTVSATRR